MMRTTTSGTSSGRWSLPDGDGAPKRATLFSMASTIDSASQHRRACDGFARAIAAADGRWQATSPCTEWNARQVVEHVIGFHDELLLKPLAAKPARPKDDVMTRWRVTADALSRVLADPAVMDENRQSLVAVLATDILIHTWDLSRAVGVDVTLDPELCEIGYERANANRDRLEASDMFGPAIAVPESASVQDKLLAIFGRDPHWAPPDSSKD